MKQRRRYPAPLLWEETKNIIQNAVLLAGATLFATWPMFLYQYQHLTGLFSTSLMTPELLDRLALTQSLIVFLTAFLCALVRFLYAERLSLPRFGGAADISFWLPVGLLGGLMLTPVSYWIIDRELLQLTPQVFPNSWSWALADMLGSALTQEVLARLGLLTVGIYFLNRWKFVGYPWLAIALIALLGMVGTYSFLLKFGLVPKFSTIDLTILLAQAFLLQWFFCAIYLRWGFLATVCIHFGLSVKLLIYTWIF